MGETSASSSAIMATDAIPLIYIFAGDILRATRPPDGPANLWSLIRAAARPKALVVLKASATASDKTAQALKEHCGQRLAFCKYSWIEFRSDLLKDRDRQDPALSTLRVGGNG
jgi:hypothetical protein